MKKTAPALKSRSGKAPAGTMNEIATRARSVDFQFFGGFLPNPDPILKKLGKDQEVYEEIMGDAHLSGVIATRTSGVKKLRWEIDRGKAKSEQVKMVEKRFKALGMDGMINDTLQANYRGYQPMEVNWAKPDMDGLIWPAAVVGKPPEWFQYDEDNQLRFRSLTNLQGEELPDWKFLVPRRMPSFKNPYGDALLSKCYWPMVFKRSGIKFWVTFVEKYGIPYAVGKLPRGQGEAEYEKLKTLLENMVRDAVAAVPNDASIEILEPKGTSSSAEVFERLVAWANAETSKVIVGHGSGADSTPGKLGSEDNAQEVKAYLVEEDKRLVEATMNTLLRWIWIINFGEGEIPEFSMYEEEDVDLDLAERDKSLSDQGVELSKEYYEREYGFKPGDIVKVKKPEPPAALGAAGKPLPGMQGKGPKFSEKNPPIPTPAQAALDAYADGLDAAELQAQAEGLLKPILDMIESAWSLEDIKEKLATVFADLDTKSIQNMVQRAIFVSEMLGRGEQGAGNGNG
ncbi:MAG: DUF935 family protein [Fibrobacteria bacterium]